MLIGEEYRPLRSSSITRRDLEHGSGKTQRRQRNAEWNTSHARWRLA